MARTVPVYTYQAADGRSLRFAVDSDFWITDMSGDDGLDIEPVLWADRQDDHKSVRR